MELNEEVTYTIDRVRFEGKWVEYWIKEIEKFEDNKMSFHLCSKAYMLWDCIEKAELYNDIISNGISGRKLTWRYVGPNLEPVSIE